MTTYIPKLPISEYLCHVGTDHNHPGEYSHTGSGRYSYGTGKNPGQHDEWRHKNFLQRVNDLKKAGWTPTPNNLKDEFGEDMTTTKYQKELQYATYIQKLENVEKAKRYKEQGLGNTEIGQKMGVNESTVRGWLDMNDDSKVYQLKSTIDFLRDQVKEKGMIDVSVGVAEELNITQTRLDSAIYALEQEGYKFYKGRFEQVTNSNSFTTQAVLCSPDKKHSDIYDLDKVKTITEYKSNDDGEHFDKLKPPVSMDSDRIFVKYVEDGGADKDGIIEIRRNVKDISIGDAAYAQVRVLVDNDHYIKGVAVYSDNIPEGYDILINSNKHKADGIYGALKDVKAENKGTDNPFGTLIKEGGQNYYIDENGERKQGVVNICRAQDDWSEWKNVLPSQFLSKQTKQLAEQQLGISIDNKRQEFDEIMSLENPTIKKFYLNKFADSCDKDAVTLAAAKFPGQSTNVIIPINTLKDNEIYAPQYENGTVLALVRYPHANIAEIPVLTVNNKQADAKKLLGTDIRDAVGINSKVAAQLSGADFDGDTVVCMPITKTSRIQSKAPIPDLVSFEPKLKYGAHEIVEDSKGEKHYFRNGEEYPIMKNTNTQMGIVSNLITDMTLLGAPEEHLVRAIKHSMVVIDAEKHKLDYRASEIENNIKELKNLYQDGGGASTIISRAKGEMRVDKRQGQAQVNLKGKPGYDPSIPEGALRYKTADDDKLYYVKKNYNKDTGLNTLTTTDGKKISYNPSDKEAYKKYNPVMKKDPDTGEVSFTNEAGTISYKFQKRQDKITNMAGTYDATTLESIYHHPMEKIYSSYANTMKKMANNARLAAANTKEIDRSSEARKVYAQEVSSLKAKLNDAIKNHPKEREAQRRATVEVNEWLEKNPNAKPKDVKKKKQMAINKYRRELGTVQRRERNIEITDNEWKAIQAGAISKTDLVKILNNTDSDKLRDLAMPKTVKSVSDAKASRIKTYVSRGYTYAQVAELLNISTSTVAEYAK